MTDQQKAHIHALIDEVFALHYEFKKRKDNFNMERYAIQGNGRIARIDQVDGYMRNDVCVLAGAGTCS